MKNRQLYKNLDEVGIGDLYIDMNDLTFPQLHRLLRHIFRKLGLS